MSQPVNLTKEISFKLQQLSTQQQIEVLTFIEFLAQKNKPETPIWERIQEITADIPDEDWSSLPEDGAVQHDHYLYGLPKREL